ncbi:MAG: hypothetical protein V6Z89_13880 [Desulfobacter sp.]
MVNQWRYLGHYKAKEYNQSPETIKKYHQHRPIEEVDGILFLSARDDFEITVSNRSYPDPETRKKTELTAISFVTSHYESRGYSVKDCQKDNCGYDLLGKKKNKFLKLEVKDTSGKKPRFFLTKMNG